MKQYLFCEISDFNKYQNKKKRVKYDLGVN